MKTVNMGDLVLKDTEMLLKLKLPSYCDRQVSYTKTKPEKRVAALCTATLFSA
jgi:hypothetical protein